jgi:hypothetical protein
LFAVLFLSKEKEKKGTNERGLKNEKE